MTCHHWLSLNFYAIYYSPCDKAAQVAVSMNQIGMGNNAVDINSFLRLCSIPDMVTLSVVLERQHLWYIWGRHRYSSAN